MQVYRFSFNVEDEIKAESLDEAWEIIKGRVTDRFYGPTRDNLELISEVTEEEVPE